MGPRTVLILGATAGIGAVAASDKAVRREVVFWTQAAPIALHYHFASWWGWSRGWSDTDKSRYFQSLHTRYAPKVHDLVLHLRGFFIKVAQLASTRDELVPEEYMTFLKKLQDKVPVTMSADQAREMLHDELGADPHTIFADLDLEQVIGSATIGQVYKAKLRATGEEVALKLQYPGVEPLFRLDLQLCLNFCKLFMKQHVPWMEEFQAQFENEFDYKKEGALLSDMACRTEKSHMREKVFVPRSFPAYTTKRVLCMQLVRGAKLLDVLQEEAEREARRLGVATHVYIEQQRVKGPPSERYMRTVQLLLRGLNCLIAIPEAVYNAVVGRLTGHTVSWQYPIPINVMAILSVLIEAHAWQVFDEGRFNADPHPGNVLLQPDGRLGLVDFGQVGELSVRDRLNLVDIFRALCRNDRRGVVESLDRMGFCFRYSDEELKHKYALFHFSKLWDDHSVTGGRNPLAMMDWLHAQNPLDVLPQQWVLLNRMLLVLCGFKNALGIKCNTAADFLPYGERWAAAQGRCHFA